MTGMSYIGGESPKPGVIADETQSNFKISRSDDRESKSNSGIVA